MGAKKQRCSGKFAIALATEFLAGYSKTTDLLPGKGPFGKRAEPSHGQPQNNLFSPTASHDLQGSSRSYDKETHDDPETRALPFVVPAAFFRRIRP